MKTSIPIVLFSLLSMAVLAGELGEDYGLTYPKNIQADGYSLTLDRVELYQNEVSDGLFSFRWEGSEPIKIWGMRFDEDGAFRVVFENTALFDGEQWTATNYGHCGTGAKLFTFEPGKDYQFRIAIRQFHGAIGEKGLVAIGGDSVSVISEPFLISTLEKSVASEDSVSTPDSGRAE